jgi:two-component system, chemotaxis family, CheB/CheR fusion protein
MKKRIRAPKPEALHRGGQAISKAVPREHDDFPVAGIGASAGGLEAFTKLFTLLPNNSGMAFILIQHLDPTHESMMVALLSSHTAMKVLQATDGMRIERDHVYVIPPRVYLSIDKGFLHLSAPRERHGVRMPFDFFLRSLAEEYGERAVCAILSGTGADGSLGVKAIKEKGGLVIVQDPAEAAYDGMPRSAILTGVADYLLPIEKMPAALAKFARGAILKRNPSGGGSSPSPEAKLAEIIELLRARTSHNFAFYKPSTLLRRIERRMLILGVVDIGRYMESLRKDSSELECLAKDLLIHVTSFFRDPAAFEALAKTTIPELIRQAASGQPLRVWIPACSTGEETYSLVMLMLEEIAAAKRNIKLQVFASDVEEAAVAIARNGWYPASIEADVSPVRLARFFRKLDDGYRVLPELREAVIFTVQDILADAPFSRIDLVSCRNLLIYLRPEVQDKVLSLFHFALRPGGILFLGSAETIGSAGAYFEPLSDGQPLYRHIGRSRPGQVAFPIGGEAIRVRPSRIEQPSASSASHLGDLSQRLLLEAYAPASVLINRERQGLYYFGAVDKYLKIAPGDANADILSMAREGLRNRLRTAIHQAAHEHARVKVPGAQLRRETRTVEVSVDVHPVEGDAGKMQLVSFIDEPERGEQPNGSGKSKDNASQLAQLERELDATREELEAAVRDLELSNEEQRAINEEAMSVNEEFQSTNEELETSREELQSLNEELTALNSQLHETVEQQRTTANDLQNVLKSANVATIFLDRNLNIRFFTPAVKSHFNIVATDVGRPLADLKGRSDDANLLIDAASVLANDVPISREFERGNGTWYLRRILPYQANDDQTEGVVITFFDISELKVVEREIEAARAYSNSIVETIRQPLVVLDGELRIVSASRAFYSILATKQEDAVGQPISSIGALSFKNSRLHAFLEGLRAGRENFEDQEIALDLPPLPGRRSLLMSAREIVGPSEGRNILVTIEDITERNRLNRVLEAAKLHAERANLGKSRFLAAASHDLRQPLQTLTLLRGILERSIKDEETSALIRKLDEPLQAMSDMLNTLLDINQLEAGTVTPEIVSFPVDALFDRLRTEFAYYAKAKGLGWRVIESGLHIRSDPRLLEQMIRNLLWNSVKYTSHGKVLLGCRRRGNKLRIEVWDTGVGIPQEHLEAIFEEFHQVENPARERSLGLGLGLAIVQRIGIMLGHVIDVRSRPGKGSVFAIEVPLASDRPGAWVPNVVPPADDAPGVPNTVMIIEDDPQVREMLDLLFKAEGHRTLALADGKAALELAKNRTAEPDIVIADYNLPGGLNGLQTIAEVRHALHRETPAIILTGDISTSTLHNIVQGRCVHLTKPANADELTRLVSTLVGAQRRRGSNGPQSPPRVHPSNPASVEPKGGRTQPAIFVIDDDAALRAALVDLLVLDGRDVEAYPSCEAFLEAYRPVQNGCLIVDAKMQGMGGLNLLEYLKREKIELPAIMITGYGDVPMAVRAMKAGAVDFIEKPVDPNELIASVENALARNRDSSTRSVWQESAAKCLADLTPREHEVMELVLAGHPSKNIAADLHISQRTVENHRASIMRKTGSKSIPALIRLALAAV